jgi:hypothetical protein
LENDIEEKINGLKSTQEVLKNSIQRYETCQILKNEIDKVKIYFIILEK